MGAVGCPVAVGRGSVLIPDAHLLRAIDSVCSHSGAPTPQTKDLNSVTVAKADASPTVNSGGGWLEDTAKEQTEVKVVTAQVREPRSCEGLFKTSFLLFPAFTGPSGPLTTTLKSIFCDEEWGPPQSRA